MGSIYSGAGAGVATADRSKWDSTYTTVCATSAQWTSAYNIAQDASYTTIDPILVAYSPSNYTADTADVSGHLQGIDDELGGFAPVDAVAVSYSPINYTVSTADVSGHLQGIDTELGELTPADSVLVIYNPTNYTAATSSVSGHLQGIDNALIAPPAQTRIVAISGTEYTSIQSAIDSIADADSSTKPYIVQVYPGTYMENITLKDGVGIKGMGSGKNQITISPVSGTIITWTAGSTESNIDGIKISGAPAPYNNDALIVVNNGSHLIQNCTLEWIMTGPYNATEIVMVSSYGTAEVSLDECIVNYQQSNNIGIDNVPLRILESGGSAINRIDNSNCTMTIADSSANVYIIKDESNSNIDRYFQNNEFDINITNANFSGKASIVEAAGGTYTMHFLSNVMHISSVPAASANNHATIYESYEGTGDTIHSASNIIELEGFGSSYIAAIDSTATVKSHFDNTNAISELSGAGTFYYVYSPSNGNLEVSNNLVVENVITVPLLTGDNTLIKSDSSGIIQDTTVSITVGPTGGSVINFAEFTTDPDVGDLVTGDMWITDSPATSGKLWKYFDGTNKYSVELSME